SAARFQIEPAHAPRADRRWFWRATNRPSFHGRSALSHPLESLRRGKLAGSEPGESQGNWRKLREAKPRQPERASSRCRLRDAVSTKHLFDCLGAAQFRGRCCSSLQQGVNGFCKSSSATMPAVLRPVNSPADWSGLEVVIY